MKYLLFSPVGSTDPIRDMHDGPLLHIARWYKPEIIILFLSKEMGLHDKADNRYERCIQAVLPECRVEKIYSEIEDVHNFDRFMNSFPEQFSEIHKKYPDHSLLLNLSSGTPQMQMTLALESALSFTPCLPIQVTTPAKKANSNSQATVEDFDFDILMSTNFDQQESPAPNRCIQLNFDILRKNNAKNKILSLIDTYSYESACLICKDVKELFVPELFSLLEHCALRSNLRISEAKKLLSKVDTINLFPVEENKLQNLSEYFMSIQIRQSRGEFPDMFLRMTPFLYELAKFYLIDIVKFPLDKITYTDKNNDTKLSISKMQSFAPDLLVFFQERFNNNFRDSHLSFHNILVIIDFLLEQITKKYTPIKINSEIVLKLWELRKYEEKLRNPLAHNVQGISEADIKKTSVIINNADIKFEKNKTSKKLIADMKFVLDKIFTYRGKTHHFLYDIINTHIQKIINI